MFTATRNFLWRCAGANVEILEGLNVEHVKYASIGLTVLLTGVFATFSGGYAMYFVFSGSDYAFVASIIVGLVWGLSIFNLDRYLVSSISKQGIWKDLGMATPRLLLAIVIGYIVATPLELRLFQKEINEGLRQYYIENQGFEYDKKIATFNKKYSIEQSQILAWKGDIERLEKQKSDLDIILGNEATGVASSKSSGVPGFGPLSQIRKEEMRDKQREIDTIANRVYKLETFIRQRKDAEGFNDITQMNNQTLDSIVANAGFHDRYKILHRISGWSPSWPSMRAIKGIIVGQATEAPSPQDTLKQDNGAVSVNKKEDFSLDRLNGENDGVAFFVSFLFILIECIPIVIKLITSRGRYEDALDKRSRELKIVLREELKINRSVTSRLALIQNEITRTALEKYRDAEINRLELDENAYRDYFSDTVERRDNFGYTENLSENNDHSRRLNSLRDTPNPDQEQSNGFDDI
jgi:hypothetical protein